MFRKICLLITFVLLLSACGVTKQDKNVATEKTTQLTTPIKIGFCQVGKESGWREAHTNSILEAFNKANGYEIDYVNADGDQQKQFDTLRKFINDGVQLIILAPVVEDGWDVVLKEVKDAGIPVIISDRKINVSDESLYTCWVGSNFKAEGLNAIDWLKNYMEVQGKASEQHKIVILQGTLGSSAELGRTSGIHDAISQLDNYEIVFEKTGDFTREGGKAAMEEFLATNQEFDVLISQNDDMTFGAIEAMKAAGLNPGSDITVISFDAIKEAFQATIDGDINVLIECNPLQGPFIKDLTNKILANEDVEKTQYMYEDVFDATKAKEEINNRVY